MKNNSDKSATGQCLQPNKYNSKELDLMHGLNTYDYGARQYDPITVTWNGMDPLSEKYRQFYPLAYCMDNPVKFVTPRVLAQHQATVTLQSWGRGADNNAILSPPSYCAADAKDGKGASIRNSYA